MQKKSQMSDVLKLLFWGLKKNLDKGSTNKQRFENIRLNASKGIRYTK